MGGGSKQRWAGHKQSDPATPGGRFGRGVGCAASNYCGARGQQAPGKQTGRPGGAHLRRSSSRRALALASISARAVALPSREGLRGGGEARRCCRFAAGGLPLPCRQSLLLLLLLLLLLRRLRPSLSLSRDLDLSRRELLHQARRKTWIACGALPSRLGAVLQHRSAVESEYSGASPAFSAA